MSLAAHQDTVLATEQLSKSFGDRTALDGVDALILPPYAGGMLVVTNATGHPTLCLRSGFDAANAPRSITLIGHPFDEATLLSTGAALEAQLGVAERQPDMSWM